MENKILKSGEFLVSEVEARDVFIPEEFNEEQRMIAQTCSDFLEAEQRRVADAVEDAAPERNPGQREVFSDRRILYNAHAHAPKACGCVIPRLPEVRPATQLDARTGRMSSCL